MRQFARERESSYSYPILDRLSTSRLRKNFFITTKSNIGKTSLTIFTQLTDNKKFNEQINSIKTQQSVTEWISYFRNFAEFYRQIPLPIETVFDSIR